MRSEREIFEAVNALSRRELVRQLQAAEGIAPDQDRAREDEAESADDAQIVWDQLARSEGDLLFPPFEIPPFEYPESDAAADTARTSPLDDLPDDLPAPKLRSANRLWPAAAAAALAFVCGVFATLYLAGGRGGVIDSAGANLPDGATATWFRAETYTPQALAEPQLLLAPATIEAPEGRVAISRGMALGRWSSAGQSLTAFDLAADFAFAAPVQFTVRHPRLDIQVTGTRFRVALTPESGSVRVLEGSVVLEERGAAGAPRRITLQANEVGLLDAQGIRRERLSAGPAAAGESSQAEAGGGFPADTLVQRFRLANGRSVIGFVVRRTGTEIFVQTRSGAIQTILKGDLVSSETIQP